MGELGAVTIALWGSLVQASWVLVRVSAFVVTAPVLFWNTRITGYCWDCSTTTSCRFSSSFTIF